MALASLTIDACSSDATNTTDNPGPLACATSGSDGSDSDCAALGLPRKLGCDTEADMQAALARGCQREDSDKATDFDVCCPTTVEGTPKQPEDTGTGVPPTDTGAKVDSGSVVDTSTDTKTDSTTDTKTGLGIGEKCTSETQCRSGVCYRPKGTTGFCTTSCSTSFDASCSGDSAGGKNSLGELINCMAFAGGGRCYPGCINGKQASCTPFGMTCRSSQKDIKGYNVDVCLEL